MPVDPRALDLSLAALFAGWGLADAVRARLEDEGFADVRFADGLVVQHLVEGPCGITALATHLGVTQQAASKTVADLERRGYVQRRPRPGDGRAREVVLTERGTASVGAARRARAAVVAEVVATVGAERAETARTVLLEVLEQLGADAAVRARRVRPPR